MLKPIHNFTDLQPTSTLFGSTWAQTEVIFDLSAPIFRLVLLGLGLAIVAYGVASYLKRQQGQRAYQLAEDKYKLRQISYKEMESFRFKLPLGFTLFNHGGSLGRFSNGQTGTVDGIDVTLFNYGYSAHVGRYNNFRLYEVACFQFRAPKLPSFTLYRQSRWQSIRAILGKSDINFGNDPQFSRKFWLVGEDESAVRSIFVDQVRDYIDQLPATAVTEADSFALIYYRGAGRGTKSSLYQLLKEGLTVVKLLHDAAEASEKEKDER